MNKSVVTRVLEVTQTPASAHHYLSKRGFILSSSGLTPPALAASFGVFGLFTYLQTYQLVSDCGCVGVALLFYSASDEMHLKCMTGSIEEAVQVLAHTPIPTVIVRWDLTNCENKHSKFTEAAFAERVRRAKELRGEMTEHDDDDESDPDGDDDWVESPCPYDPDQGQDTPQAPWSDPAPWEDDHFGDLGDPWNKN